MKITAQNEYARVVINILVSSTGEALCEDEVSAMRSVLADAIIRLLGEIPVPAFSVADQEISVKSE